MNTLQTRYVFFGTSEFAVPILDTLVEHGLLPQTIVTTPNKPAGRKLAMTVSPVKKYAAGSENLKSIPLLQPEHVDNTFTAQIRALEADTGIVVSYGKILPKTLIDAFPRGLLNIHPSLLPKYRGPSPLENTILNGDTKTGVTVMVIDDKMDHGPILAQKEFSISNAQFSNKITYSELHDTLANMGAKLLIETLPKWLDGQINAVPQDDTQATFTKLLKKENGKIDWTRPAQEIDCRVRALNPWPGTYALLKNGKILKIKKVEETETPASSQAGAVFERDGYPAVVCGKGALKLLVVHPENRREISGQAFLRGYPQIVGNNIISSSPQRSQA